MKPNYGTHSFLKNYIKYFRKLFKNNNLEVKDLHYLLQNNGIMPDKVEDEKTGKIMPMYKRAQLDALINGYTVGWDKVDIHKLKSDYSEYLRKLNAPPPKPKETKRWGKIEIPEYHPEYEEENIVTYKKPEYPKDDVTNSDLDWNNENDMESISKQLEKQYQTENTKYKMKRKIVLTESDLHKVVKKSVKQILKEYNIQQIPYSNNMQTSMDNGFDGQNNQEVMQYIGDLPNYVGKVTNAQVEIVKI